jgi:hypothetical protein
MARAVVTTIVPNADWSNVTTETQHADSGCAQSVLSTLQTMYAENPTMRVLFVVCRRYHTASMSSKLREMDLESAEIQICHVDSLYKLEGCNGSVPDHDLVVLFDWIAGYRCLLSLPNRTQTYRILEAIIYKSKKIIKTH